VSAASGNYDIIIFAWVGTPFPFAGAQQLWGSTSDSNYGKWVNTDSDKLLADAASQTDKQKAIPDLNDADQIMSSIWTTPECGGLSPVTRCR
jgi:peptide/nickel transport system substrate-binding protein